MKYISISEKIHLNFPGMSIGDDGALISTNKLKFGRKKRMELRKEFEKLHNTNPEKYKDFNAYKNSLDQQSLNFLAPPGYNMQHKISSIQDGNTTEDTISLIAPSPREFQNVKLPYIKEHVPNSSKILENKIPNRFSKKMILESISKGGKIKFEGENAQNDNEDYQSEALSLLKYYKSKRKNTKNIHDKFNTAIRLDQNWGVSSKVATDIAIDIKRKSVDINYRKIRIHNKTPSDLVSKSQLRSRIPKHNNLIGVSVGLIRKDSDLPQLVRISSYYLQDQINNSMRNSQNSEGFLGKY